MKKTVFEFETRLADGVDDRCFTELKAACEAIDGVIRVELQRDSGFADLHAYVQFGEVAEAKAIHDQLGDVIEAAEGFQLIGMTSILTDIFDD